MNFENQKSKIENPKSKMQIIQQLKEIWGRLPMPGRIATVSAAIVSVALTGWIIYYGSQPDYAVLFSDLKPEDAQSIIEKLKAENVSYTLTSGGTTVSVPAERVSELRLQMASTGVLSGGHVGFDLFDKTTFGATDFAQQVNFRRAVEGELAKTLEGMDEVEQARVHITPKKESVFSEKEEGAKASVMVRVRQGKELSNERTEAIVSLISSSVEGLDPSSVSVMDTRGRLLTDGRGNKNGRYGDAGTFNAQLEARRKFETETASRIISLIEPIAGDGRVRADVAADVDFSQIEQTEEKYNPDSKVVRSQQTTQELKTQNSNNPVTQIVGARPDDQTGQTQTATAQSTQSGNDQRTTAATNYEIDKTVKKTIGGGGRVNRLTVSVLVDYKNVNNVESARSSEELQKIQQLVAAAVGTDENRGDSVVVQTMPFDKPQLDESSASWLEKNKQFVSPALKYAAFLIVALLLLFFVVRPAKKAVRAAMLPPADPKLLGAGDEESLQRRETDADFANLPPMTIAELEAKMRGEIDDIKTPNIENVRAKLIEQALVEPELVAGTLRGWLRE